MDRKQDKVLEAEAGGYMVNRLPAQTRKKAEAHFKQANSAGKQ